jgi:hypothetical protein
MLKFTKGFDDLANLNFGRFNEKLRAKEPMIKLAFADDQATYVLVPIHTGGPRVGSANVGVAVDLGREQSGSERHTRERLRCSVVRRVEGPDGRWCVPDSR